MASLGSFLLMATFVVSAYAVAASVAGARRGSRRLVESGVGAFYLAAALMTVASAVIIHAFVTDDYTIKYVQRYSDSLQPLFYKLTSYWGGLDGSIMFWVFLLAVFGIARGLREPRAASRADSLRRGDHLGRADVLPVPDDRAQEPVRDLSWSQTPADGRGLNPLLQNIYMVIHPPALYIGFVGMTIPYAFGMAALITGHLDDSWLRAVRRWTMVELAVPVVRPDARHDLGVRGARVGRLLGLGPGRERGAAAVVHGHGVPALGHGAGAARHAAGLERRRSSSSRSS